MHPLYPKRILRLLQHSKFVQRGLLVVKRLPIRIQGRLHLGHEILRLSRQLGVVSCGFASALFEHSRQIIRLFCLLRLGLRRRVAVVREIYALLVRHALVVDEIHVLLPEHQIALSLVVNRWTRAVSTLAKSVVENFFRARLVSVDGSPCHRRTRVILKIIERSQVDPFALRKLLARPFLTEFRLLQFLPLHQRLQHVRLGRRVRHASVYRLSSIVNRLSPIHSRLVYVGVLPF
mmetsp:Transcript_1050/g.3201  ORF Transcript_1050/g.3201 Transcript_1050/m.3201 type:complete len:234 (+) Transcript_1050:890-1591(+)